MERAWNGSIRTLLHLVVLAVLLPAAALVAYDSYAGYQRDQQQAANAALSLAQVTSDGVEAFLADTEGMLAALARRPRIRAADAADCDPIFAEFHAVYPHFANFTQANLDGELICSALPQPGGGHMVVRDTAWFQRVLATQAFVVSAPYRGRVTRKEVSVLVYPVRDDAGRLVGSIQLPIDLVDFKLVAGAAKLPSTTILAILDSQGTIVARSQQAAQYVGTRPRNAPIVPIVLARRSGTARAVSSEGIERIYGFVPIRGTDWFALAATDTHSMLTAARRAALGSAGFGIGVVLFALAVATLLRRRITAPMRALAETARQVASGHTAERAPETGPAEVAAVAAQLNVMLDARRHAEQALRASEESYRMLFESSLDAVLLTQPLGRILHANPAACRMFGYSDGELQALGREVILDLSDERLAPLLERRARDGRATGEIRMRRKGGSLFECEIASSTFIASNGEPMSNVLVRDISDRVQADRLRAEREAARLASREKSAFLARMSHELRTPLNAIMGFSQLLEVGAGNDTPATVRVKAAYIHAAGSHLLAMINDVLDLSRIEAGALSMSPEAVAVDALANECLALVASLASAQGVSCRLALVSPTPWVRGDRIRLRQVLVNLLGNAIKYNRRDGWVEVAAKPAEGGVEIAVSDSGRGLNAAQQAQLFQPFNRLGAEATGVEGTGLGLVIVRELVTLMGGRVGVVSAPGAGATFTLWLPRAEGPAAIDAPPPSTLPAASAAAPSARRRSVLYVEDNPSNVALMQEIATLRPALDLRVAADGRGGLAAARAVRPALILLDINLPDISGFEVLRALRADPALAGVRCVALSANAIPAEIERARAAGFADYLTKPIRVDELLRLFDATLAAT
jgi:PAS domain S-box-containing protein